MLKTTLADNYRTQVSAENANSFGSYIWNRAILEAFIEDPKTSNIVLLGGDILEKDDSGRLNYTYDSWSVPGRSPTDSYEAYCKLSRENAREYLKIMRRGDNVFIVPVLTDEMTAGLLAK
jgi:hypothetical protein